MVFVPECDHASDILFRRVHKKKATHATDNHVIPLPNCGSGYNRSSTTTMWTPTSCFMWFNAKMQNALVFKNREPSYPKTFHPQKAGK
jgi:hypothetical protein